MFVNSNGVLIAQLVDHHDHIDKSLKTATAKITSIEGRQILFEKLSSIAKLARRFERTTICLQCNESDGKAKTYLGLPSDFSFSPAEIAQFVSVKKDNELHIDYDAAKSVYEEAKTSFNTRTSVIDILIGAIELGTWHHSKEDIDIRRTQYLRNTNKSTTRSLQLEHMSDYGEISLYFKMLHRSTQYDHVRASQSQDIRIPGDAVFSAIAERDAKWAATPDNWVCPGCNRNKYDVVRWSNKGKWTGLIYRRTDSLKTSDFFMQPVIYDPCCDCDILRQDIRKLMHMEDLVLHASDLRAIIGEALPHQLHTFDLEYGQRIALARMEQYEQDKDLIREAEMFQYYANSADEYIESLGIDKTNGLTTWHRLQGSFCIQLTERLGEIPPILFEPPHLRR